MDGVLEHATGVEPLAVLSRFRRDFHACLTARADELPELVDVVLCADGPVRTLAGLSLAPEHRRGHGALYDAVNYGRVDTGRLRRSLAGPFSCHSGRSDRPEMTTLRYRNDDFEGRPGPYCPVDAGDGVTVCDLGV